MHNLRLPASVLLFAVLLFRPVATAGEDDRFLRGAAEAARFVAGQAKSGDAGSTFPEYAEKPKERGRSLYSGSAGVLVFLENAARVLDDPKLRELADKVFPAIGDGAAGPALYSGSAGVGTACLIRARIREDASAAKAAARVADRLVASFRMTGEGAGSWDRNCDIISGAAGTILFLLSVGREEGGEKYLRVARAAGRGLARHGVRKGGTAWWPARAGSDRHYPHFSHGTSGVAYALARVWAATGDEECRDAALLGARWLLENATADERTMNWGHYLPGHEKFFQEGWCHGPAGTARLFLLLHSLTKEERYLDAARRTAQWIILKKPDPGNAESRTRFYSPSLCCGAAGVIDIFVDLFRATGDPRYRDYARQVGDYLLRISKRDGDGRKWTNYDRPDEDGVIYHGVSLMLGAAGEGLALLRLATIDRERDPIVHLPDRLVGGAPSTAPPAEAPPMEPPDGSLRTTTTTPADGHHGQRYIVLTNRHASRDPYFRAALALARWRKGELITDFDPLRPEAVVPRLRELGARYVAIVLPPEEIDANTQRRFLMAAARLDSDIFQDVAYGFITGTGKTSALDLVERAKVLSKRGLRREWVKAAVTTGIKCTVNPGAGDPTAKRAGFAGRQIYWSAREADPQVLEFVAAELPKFKGGGVVSFSGCGDPEGIWLFDDHRNAERDKHWPFDPGKVGQDPEGEMPRITAGMFDGVDFTGSVVITGVCHLGSLHRVFVEADIVSTFGRVTGHTEYVIPGERSVGRAILDAGAAAYIAPLGPNHGFRTLVEAQEGLEQRLSLGDILRSTYDDIAMALGRAPELGLYTRSEQDVNRGHLMASGGANRLLYGDPALSPFADVEVEPAIEVSREELPRGSGFLIRAVSRHRDWWSWNMFGERNQSERIRLVVELQKDDPEELLVIATARNAAGELVLASGLDAHVECIDGGRRLHLQIAAPGGSGLRKVGASAEFRLSELK